MCEPVFVVNMIMHRNIIIMGNGTQIILKSASDARKPSSVS